MKELRSMTRDPFCLLCALINVCNLSCSCEEWEYGTLSWRRATVLFDLKKVHSQLLSVTDARTALVKKVINTEGTSKKTYLEFLYSFLNNSIFEEPCSLR